MFEFSVCRFAAHTAAFMPLVTPFSPCALEKPARYSERKAANSARWADRASSLAWFAARTVAATVPRALMGSNGFDRSMHEIKRRPAKTAIPLQGARRL